MKLDMEAAALADKLTAAGLEVDSISPVAFEFSGIVVAEIDTCRPHPNAASSSAIRGGCDGASPLDNRQNA